MSERAWNATLVSLALAALGGCVCPAGQASCGDTCTNLVDDAANCGRCGNRCDWRCEQGACVPRPACGPDALDPDCDDGNPCNGVEQCALGPGGYRCLITTPPITCNDGVRCTSDTCMPDGSCTFTPSSSACGANATCDPQHGCILTCDHEGCGLLDQCGCASQDSCLPSTTGGLAACGTAGMRALGERCFAGDDCEEGAACELLASDGSYSMCLALCTDDAACAGGGPRCIERGQFSSAEPSVGICAPNCDPVNNQGCPSGSRCTLLASDTGTIAGCIAPPGTVRVGSSCTSHAQCASGLLCIRDATSNAYCRTWCHVGDTCASGRCTRLSPAVVLGGIEYGACL